MFTGIVQAMVPVAWVDKSPRLCRYALTLPPSLLEKLIIGASISVNGVCQTVISINNNEVAFDAIKETLNRTNIKLLEEKQWVNVERAAKMGDEIGGHPLSGHIIGTGNIIDIAFPSAEQKIMTIGCHPDWMKYLFSKGFIALNGVSLTVVDVFPKGKFTVHLIPETLRVTTFGKSVVGDEINIEIDSQTKIIVETIIRHCEYREANPVLKIYSQ